LIIALLTAVRVRGIAVLRERGKTIVVTSGLTENVRRWFPRWDTAQFGVL